MYFQLKMVISHCYVNLPVGILYTFPESSYMFGSNPTTLRPYGTSRLKARSLRQRKFMRSRGHVCVCVGTYFFKFQANEQDHLKGINVYIALLFSPVPFTGCLRAYRFHFTSLFPKDPCIICLRLFFW